MWLWCVFEGCMCDGGHFKKISFKVFTVHCVVFPLIFSSRRFKWTNLDQFWHRNISNIETPEETWDFDISKKKIYILLMFLTHALSFKWAKLMPIRVNKILFKHTDSTFPSISVQTHQSLMLIDFNFTKIWNTLIDSRQLLLPVA